jgi:sugar/nucleoside kinase (ribokinase family)
MYDVVAAGLAYVDEIFADVPAELLTRYGIPLGGGRPCPPEILDALSSALPSPVQHPGGSSANTLAVMAAQGGRTGYFGKSGHDKAGAAFREDFKRRGIPMLCDPYALSSEGTARCLVLCTPPPLSERSFAYHDGCADAFTMDDFEGFDFASTRFLLIEALLLRSDRARPAIQALIERAAPLCRIAVSLHGTAGWYDRQALARFIAATAHLIGGNDSEQRDFQSALGESVGQRPAGRIIVTTLGTQGARAETDGTTLHVDATSVSETEYVNTVGAGDAFLGGFLLAAAGGCPVNECLTRGVASATAMLKVASGRPSRFAH